MGRGRMEGGGGGTKVLRQSQWNQSIIKRFLLVIELERGREEGGGGVLTLTLSMAFI